MLSKIVNNRYLLLQMTKREIEGRYRGSYMGMLWAFVYPILMLLVYMFVFGVVMKLRWGVEGRDNVEFGVILFSGLILHGLLGEVFARSSGLISGNVQFVKKIVFPLEILSVITILTALFHLLLSMSILLLAILLTGGTLHWTIVLVPVVLLPFVVMLLGLSWLISTLCVYVRDLGQIMGVLVTILLFLSPIVYPMRIVPEAYRLAMMWLNPLTVIVQELRAVVLFGDMPNWLHLGLYSIVALFVLCFSYWFFTRAKDGFADVI